jgi:hypothetical protein
MAMLQALQAPAPAAAAHRSLPRPYLVLPLLPLVFNRLLSQQLPDRLLHGVCVVEQGIMQGPVMRC